MTSRAIFGDLRTLQNAAAATGEGTALDVKGSALAVVQVTSIGVATITFEGTLDGANWVSLEAVKAGTGVKATTATTTGIYQIPCAGLAKVRANISAYTSGSVTVKGWDVAGLAPGDLLSDEDVTVTPSGTQQVEGEVADGASVTGVNPVLVAGQDGANVQSVLTDTTGRQVVVGAAAAGAAAAGNPIVMAAVNLAGNVAQLRTADQVGDASAGGDQLPVRLHGFDGSANPRLRTVSPAADPGNVGVLATGLVATDGANLKRVFAFAAGDGQNAEVGLVTTTRAGLWNGASWDRQRNNQEATALASAARTATVNGSDITNYNGRTLHVMVNVSAITATPSVVTKIQGKDPVSGTYYDLLSGTAITDVTGTGIYIFKVGPGITASAGASAADMVPRTFRVRMEHGDADSITYSVGYALTV